MYTLIIFFILTLAEAIYIWMKWDEIQEYKELGMTTAKITGLDKNKRYKTTVQLLGKVQHYVKPLFYLLGVVLLVLNLIVASILGAILNFIL